MVFDKQSNSSLKVILKTEKILIIDNVFSNMSATKWLPGLQLTLLICTALGPQADLHVSEACI